MQKMKVTPIPGGGWAIKSSTGETHRKIYPSARKAADSLKRITEGLIRFEPTPAINNVSWTH